MLGMDEDKPIYIMEIKLQLDFDEYIDEMDGDITGYLEERYKDAVEEQIHNFILDNEEMDFWTNEKFREKTGVEISKVNELGSMSLGISEFKLVGDSS